MSHPIAALARKPALLAIVALALAGCAESGVETRYGQARGPSINGTGALAELFRARGHTPRSAVRLSDELAEWAEVIVRFAPYPGPPEKKEAEWYNNWLTGKADRQIIYVPRDFDTAPEYWAGVLANLPKGADAATRERATTLRSKALDWPQHLPDPPKEVGTPEDWFAVTEPAKPPVVCKTLTGPWAVGIDAGRAALTRRAALKVESETVLLEGDGKGLAMEWTRYNGSKVLIVANGSFLLNAALLNQARRPITARVVDWVDSAPRNVAFVEGNYVVAGPPKSPSVFDLLGVAPFGWVAAQMLALGLAACLARAPRLGRARPEPPSDTERPAAHPEALGALLARTGQAADARALLDAYRRWRRPGRPSAPGVTPAPDPGPHEPGIRYLTPTDAPPHPPGSPAHE